MHETMIIGWSEEDQAYLVTFPGLAEHISMPCTHGNTYEEAAKNGQEVLTLLNKVEA